MTNSKRILKNGIFLLAGRIVSILLSIIFSIYAARKMGILNFGRFSFIISLIGYFLVFSSAELQNLLVRDIAYNKDRSDDYLTTAMVFKLIISVISIVLIVSLAKFIGRFELIIPLLIAALSIIPACIYDAFEAVFRAYEKMEYISIVTIVYSILRTIAGVSLISLGMSMVGLFIGLLIVEIIKMLMIMLYHRKHINVLRWRFSPKILSYLFKESYVLILIKGGLGLIYYRADLLFLAALVGDIAVGQFNVAVNLGGLFTMVSAIVLSTVLPIISQWHHDNQVKMAELVAILLKYTLTIFIPLIAFFTLFSNSVIRFFYGEEYLASAPVLAIAIWNALFSTLLGLQGLILLVSNKYRTMSTIYTLVVIMKVILSYGLIGKYGLIGAAIGYSLCDGIALILYHFYARTEIKGLFFGRDLIKIIFSLVIFIAIFLAARPMGNVVSFTLALVVYIFTLFLIKVVSFYELRIAVPLSINLKMIGIR